MLSVSTVAIPLIWFLIGKKMHQKKSLDYLELFLHMNLLVFSGISLYYSKKSSRVKYQQALMIGSVLVASCSVLMYHVSCFLIWPIRIFATQSHTTEVLEQCWNLKRPLELQEEPTFSSMTTHSTVEMSEMGDQAAELREPLLM